MEEKEIYKTKKNTSVGLPRLNRRKRKAGGRKKEKLYLMNGSHLSASRIERHGFHAGIFMKQNS